MKQSERIIKKGDYYEMQVIEDGFYSNKMSKKQESQTSIQQANDSIVTQLPAFAVARANYYYGPSKTYSNSGTDLLLQELEDIIREDNITDEDKQQVLKLLKEVRSLKEEPLLLLTQRNNDKIKEKQQTSFKKIELRVKLDLKNLESKIQTLQKFSYPEIAKLEHQLQILLGEKKANHNVSLPKDEKNKEDIENLFATFNSLSCINNLPGLINKIHGNNGKYVEIANWANNAQDSIALHTDLLAELKQDELLLNKLEQGFKQNVEVVRSMIAQIKKQAGK